MSYQDMNMECTLSSSKKYAVGIHVQKLHRTYTGAMRHRLREIRKDKGLTQQEMADIFEMSLRGYVYIEQGDRDLQQRHIKLAAPKLQLPETDFWHVDPLVNKIKSLSQEARDALEVFLNKLPTKD